LKDSRSSGGFLRLQAALGAALLLLLVFVQPPPSLPALAGAPAGEDLPALAPSLGSSDGGLASSLGSLPSPLEFWYSAEEVIPRTTTIVNVHLGPGNRFGVVGLVPRGARLEVVGRDQSGDWLAITFTPGSPFHGWVESAKVVGLPSVLDLPVAPVTQLASP
jgi:hypothetical protein